MWYVKKAASSVVKLSKSVLPTSLREKAQSRAEQLAIEIIRNKKQIMPVTKMSELAELSYNIEDFECIVRLIEQKLQYDFEYQSKVLKRQLNILVLVSYLIKNGASGFIDEFRGMIRVFEMLRVDRSQGITFEDKIAYLLTEIKSRSAYICNLLFDKKALIRQKEILMMVKQKLIIHSKKGDNYSIQSPQRPEKGLNEKLDNFLEHYLWKYTAKVDRKIDKITQKLIQKIDIFLADDLPQNFEIDQLEQQEEQSTKAQNDLDINRKSSEKQYIQQKLNQKFQQTKSKDLLELGPKVIDLM